MRRIVGAGSREREAVMVAKGEKGERRVEGKRDGRYFMRCEWYYGPGNGLALNMM